MNATMPAISAELRTATGKSASSRLRTSGRIPAVAYGKGLPATNLAVSPAEVLSVLKSEHGKNSVIKLDVQGPKAQNLIVMIGDYSYHPLSREIEHVDFVEVKLDAMVDVDVVLILNGKPAGVVQGGIVRQVFRKLPVRCLPDRIPAKVEVDISPLKLSEHIATKDIALPEGVAIRLPAEQTIVAIVAPEKDRNEEAAAAAGAAAPAGGKGAAAPAGGKAAAAPAKDAKKK